MRTKMKEIEGEEVGKAGGTEREERDTERPRNRERESVWVFKVSNKVEEQEIHY